MDKACSGCYYILCINAFVGVFSMVVNLFSNNVNVKFNIMNMENVSKYFQIALPKMMWNWTFTKIHGPKVGCIAQV